MASPAAFFSEKFSKPQLHLIILLTTHSLAHSCPLCRVARRAATKDHHVCRFRASFWMVPQVRCMVLSSASTVRRQVFLGLSLFRFPSAVQWRTVRVMLSAMAYASFHVSYIVLTFQNPILVLNLALKTSIFLSAVPFRLLPLLFIRVSFDEPESPSRPVVLIFFVAVSVTWVFYGTGLLALCPTPLSGGPVDRASSDLYPLTLPGEEAPAGTALGVSEALKSADHDKVAILRGILLTYVYQRFSGILPQMLC